MRSLVDVARAATDPGGDYLPVATRRFTATMAQVVPSSEGVIVSKKPPVGGLCAKKTFPPIVFSVSSTSSTPEPWQCGYNSGQDWEGSRHKVCQHNRRRTRCPQCNGKSLCSHQNKKYIAESACSKVVKKLF
jgi:hypothetical protein